MNSVDLSAARWSKSSHSGGDSGSCVEIAPIVQWRKSGHSGGESGDCVEIAVLTSADTASL